MMHSSTIPFEEIFVRIMRIMFWSDEFHAFCRNISKEQLELYFGNICKEKLNLYFVPMRTMSFLEIFVKKSWNYILFQRLQTDEEVWPDCSIGVEQVKQQGSTLDKGYYVVDVMG